MSDLFPITLGEQIAEVEREIKERARVYPRLIANGGRLSQERADRQVAVMRAVLASLRDGA